MLEEHPQYTGILTIHPDGTLFCDSLRTGRELNLTDRRYFREVLDPANRLAVEPVFGRLTGVGVLQVAYAARRDGGEPAFVLLASVDLQRLIAARARTLIRKDEVVAIADAKGTVLAWHPENRGSEAHALPGSSIAGTKLFDFALSPHGADVREDIAFEGAPQIWATSTLSAFPGAGLYVLVGTSTDSLLADANRTFAQALATQSVVWLLVLATAWLLARRAMHREQAEGERIRSLNLELEQGLQTNLVALKQAQAALPDSEARLQQAQEIANIGSWELDFATGRFAWSRNLYRIRGLPTEFQPTRENMRDRILPEDLPTITAWFTDLNAGTARGPIEVSAAHPDGKLRMLRYEGRLVTEADGTIRRIVGTVQDVTDRRLIEQQLAQAQKMEAIGNLTGGMAHDFNNLLNVIVLSLECLRDMREGDSELAALTDNALAAAFSGADLTHRLLAFARQQPLRPREIDVNALVSHIVRLITRTLGENIQVSLALDGGVWPIVADPAQLEASLVNLANNSRDAMPGGGRLSIATANHSLDADYAAQHAEVAAGDYVVIAVSDTGTGMSREVASRVFEPFFTTKERDKGTGLGLAMVFGFVRQSGGHISVYSEPGTGTTFRLYLPRGTAPSAPEDAPMVRALARGAGQTILVVEDNVPLREVVVRQLTELGYRTLEATDPPHALDLLGREEVDLLLTDVVMPGGIDGAELARRARQLRPALKVLFASGFSATQIDGESRALPAEARLLTKPYSRKDLSEMIRVILAGESPA